MQKEHIEILNTFASTHTLAEGLNVNVSEHFKHFEAKNKDVGAKAEDIVLLSDIIRGAENFMYFLERNGYKIGRGK